MPPKKAPTKEQREKAARKTLSQNSIVKIRNATNSIISNKHRDVIRILSQFYRNAPDTLIKNIPAVKKMNQNEMNIYVKKQFDLIKNQRINSNNVNLNTNLSMDINKLHDFFLFLWLDMRHDFKSGDKKIGVPLTDDFDQFLKGSIVDEFAKNRKWDWNRTPIETVNMKYCLQNGIIGTRNKVGSLKNKYGYPGDNADKLLKENFADMWSKAGDPVSSILIAKGVDQKYYTKLRKDDKPIYISFDSENSHFLSGFISSSKTTGIRESNGKEVDAYLLKRLYTLANLMDPGRFGGQYATPGSSIDEIFSRLFKNEPSWAFKINAQPYIWNFGKYFTIEIFNSGKTDFKCKLNDQLLNLGITKKEAGSNNTGNPAVSKISKTFGDLNQILTVSSLRKSGKRVVSGTQDRAFIGMTGFIQRDLFNIRPQIISDSTRTGSDSIVLLGMQEYYKTNVSKANTGANSLIPTPNKRPNPSRNSPRGPLSQPSTSVESGGSTIGYNSNNNNVSSKPSNIPKRRPVARFPSLPRPVPSILETRKRKRNNNNNNKTNLPSSKKRQVISNNQKPRVNTTMNNLNKNQMIANLQAQLARAQANAKTAANTLTNASTKAIANAAANASIKANANAARVRRALKQLNISVNNVGPQTRSKQPK
ncbi:MAG: hypothetical protein ACKVIK_15165 [Rhodospirillales bacterium]|jgi:hypothetical protein